MRKLKLFMTALALVGGMNVALAEDVYKDVTSTYLTNADFEDEFSVYSNPSNDRAIYQPNGWTVSYTSGDPNDMTALNSNCLCWNNFSGKAQLSDGGNNTYWIRMRWGTGAILELSQTFTLPEGSYKLSAAYYKSGSGGDGWIFVNNANQNTSVNEDVWKNLTIDFTSDGLAQTKIGCRAQHTNTYEKFLAFDNFVLEWNITTSLTTLISKATEVYNEDTSNTTLKSAIDAAEEVKDSQDVSELETAYNNLKSVAALALNRKAWKEAKDDAEAAFSNNDYTNVTGSEKTDLQTEINKAEPTTDEGYEEAALALITATSAFTAAKASYDAFVAAKAAETPELAYAAAAKKTALTNAKAVTATSKADAEEKTAAIYQALRAYYESHALAENVDGAVDMTENITNYNATDGNNGWTWTGNKNNPRNTESWTDSNGKNDYMYFDGGNWSGTGWTTTMEQTITIPAGRYLLTAKGRASDGVTLTMSVGEESIELPNVNATGNVFDRGWCDGSVEFETNGDPITILVKATTAGNQQWFSVGDFRLVQLEENEVPMADEADYAALDEAIALYQDLELGFDEDEYAPYNNVDVILLGIEIDDLEEEKIQNKEYTKEYIQGLTARVYDILLFPNETEMNAIYDGDLANAPIQATSENVVLPGWVTKSGNTRQTFKGNGENGKACLGENEVGLFVHPGVYNYGETTGYTMPLKADTWYVASAKYCAWANGSNNNFTLTILKGSETVATKSYGPNATACTEANALKEVKLYFKTSDAADYVLSVNANGNTFMTGFHIIKAVVIDEEATSAPTAKTNADVVLSRTLSKDIWNTFSVPFDAAIPEGWTVKEFVSAEDNTLNFQTATSIQAGVPYLVKTEADVVNPTFEGVTVEATEGETIGEGDYQFAAQIYNKELATDGTIAYLATDGTIKKLNSANGLKGLRAYFIIPASSAGARIAFIDDGGTTTGIESMASEVQKVENGVYDLQGRRVEAMKKGLYIVNGKKVVK